MMMDVLVVALPRVPWAGRLFLKWIFNVESAGETEIVGPGTDAGLQLANVSSVHWAKPHMVIPDRIGE
jgi:hypothetical protein